MEDNKKKEKISYIKIFIGLAIICCITGIAKELLKNSLFNNGHTQQIKNSQNINNKTQDLKIASSSEPSNGVTQNDMDIKFLKNAEKYFIDRIENIAKKTATEQFGEPSNIDASMNHESLYVESNGIKFAVIRFSYPEQSNGVIVLAIQGEELKRVACAGMTSEKISITSGPCADKIKETFGTAI